MDTSRSLAIESFSHSWLNNTRFSIDDEDDPLRTSLYLYDDDDISWKIGTSKRFIEPQNPNFNFHSTELSPSLIHADEIFSNGKILPIYRDGSIREERRASPMTSPISSRAQIQNENDHHSFLIKWRKSSKKIFTKSLGLFRPFCSKFGCSREGVKVDDFDRKLWAMNSLDSSPQASPPQRRDGNFVGDHWFDIMMERENERDVFEKNLRKAKSWSHFPPQFNSDWSVESSIYEAILHCKKSCEK